MCLKLLLQQQPVARDLRADLRRAEDDYRHGAHRRSGGGHCRDHHASWTGAAPEDTAHYRGNGDEATIKMVTDSVDAYVQQDIKLAEKVIAYDDVVDDCFDQREERADRHDRAGSRRTANTRWIF